MSPSRNQTKNQKRIGNAMFEHLCKINREPKSGVDLLDLFVLIIHGSYYASARCVRTSRRPLSKRERAAYIPVDFRSSFTLSWLMYLSPLPKADQQRKFLISENNYFLRRPTIGSPVDRTTAGFGDCSASRGASQAKPPSDR